MILTSEFNNGIISHIKSVTLTFDDSGEIVLDSITDYDMEFNKTSVSIVEFKNCIIDKDIIHIYANGVNITHIKIVMEIYNTCGHEKSISCLDIPCKMKIEKLRYIGNQDITSDCTITLEGIL